MRCTLMIASLTMFIYSHVMAQDTTCPSDLIHYWKFDEVDTISFRDYVGNLDAIVIDQTVADSGRIGIAQIFKNSKLVLAEDSTFDWEANSSFTMEVWINKSSTCPPPGYSTHNNVLIGRDADTTGLHWWFGISCTNPGKVNFSLYSNDGNGLTLESKSGIIDGEWHLVSVVRDGSMGTTSILIDGIVDTSAFFTYTDGFAAEDSVEIGWLNLNNFYHYSGMMDELAIYSSAVADSVLLKHYNSGIAYCSNFADDSTDTDTTQADSIYTITIDFKGMTPHIGQNLSVYLNNGDSIETLDSLFVTPVDTADFTVVFDSLQNDTNYIIDFWADMNANNSYDTPPVDHAWRIELMNITSDTTIVFVHNTEFTDIFDDGSDTTIVDTSNYQLTITFTGFTENIGQDLIVYVRDPGSMEFIDSMVINSLDSSDFTIVFDSLAVDNLYNIDFYTDVNGNGVYDLPPVDQSWRIELRDIDADTIVTFMYDTLYTDIGLAVTGTDHQEHRKLTTYPNPVKGELNISLENGGSELSIYNTSGTLVTQRKLTPADRLVRINVSTLKPGIYILHVATDSGIRFIKFIKE